MHRHTNVMFDVDVASLTLQEKSLLRRLKQLYTPKLIREVLLPLVEQTSPVSLRTLDWCVTNWSKQHNIVCSAQRSGHFTNVHHAYRTMLSFWKRRLFDPFRRRRRVRLNFEGASYETTLGQANFAIWSHESGVLAYAKGHLEEIEKDMNSISQVQKRKRKEAKHLGFKRQRRELTPAPRAMCVAYRAPLLVTFEDDV